MKAFESSPMAARKAIGPSFGGHSRNLRAPTRATIIPAMTALIMNDVGFSVARPAEPRTFAIATRPRLAVKPTARGDLAKRIDCVERMDLAARPLLAFGRRSPGG